ncbi:MAG: hypothetical protein F6K19_09750 [Cyanothece sp. SIO1E1]|nr:hypothetical protein [Cyanothece sp. SIO1E1]
MAKPFLYQLFETTRTKLKLPLGVEEYDALLQLIEKRDVIQSAEDLRFACEVLWIKQTIHLEPFRALFQNLQETQLEQVLALLAEVAQKKETPENQEDETPNNTTTSPESAAAEEDTVEDIPSAGETEQAEEKVEQQVKKQEEDAEVLLSLEESEEGVALREEKHISQSILAHPYILSDAYHPINQRDMRQSWRFLRQQTPTYFTSDIDLQRTIRDFAREGFLGKVHYQRQFEDQVKLLLLIDYKGSMIAFHSLANQLIHTATYDQKIGQAKTFFFHDVPKAHLFLNMARTKAIRKEKLLQKLSTKHTRVLIFSDAGAARGKLDLSRIDDTWDFLDELRPMVRQIAWLNPIPRRRWANTTAAEIAEITPMFETSANGFRAAIRHLRGKSA